MGEIRLRTLKLKDAQAVLEQQAQATADILSESVFNYGKLTPENTRALTEFVKAANGVNLAVHALLELTETSLLESPH